MCVGVCMCVSVCVRARAHVCVRVFVRVPVPNCPPSNTIISPNPNKLFNQTYIPSAKRMNILPIR